MCSCNVVRNSLHSNENRAQRSLRYYRNPKIESLVNFWINNFFNILNTVGVRDYRLKTKIGFHHRWNIFKMYSLTIIGCRLLRISKNYKNWGIRITLKSSSSTYKVLHIKATRVILKKRYTSKCFRLKRSCTRWRLNSSLLYNNILLYTYNVKCIIFKNLK